MKKTPRRRAWDIFALERLLINIEAKSFSREAVFTARTHGASMLANFSTVYFPRYYTRPNVAGFRFFRHRAPDVTQAALKIRKIFNSAQEASGTASKRSEMA